MDVCFSCMKELFFLSLFKTKSWVVLNYLLWSVCFLGSLHLLLIKGLC
jgi:hypothetical protein